MDPIANMLTTIKNANILGKSEAIVPFSSFKSGILEILKRHRYIKDFKVLEENEKKKAIRVELLSMDGTPRIQKARSISKQSRRIYVKSKEIPFSLGILIISTSKGLMDHRSAKKENLGGELICEML